jgi:hypothetical protein
MHLLLTSLYANKHDNVRINELRIDKDVER